MAETYDYLESNDSNNCQFSMDQLGECISGEKPSVKAVENKLWE